MEFYKISSYIFWNVIIGKTVSRCRKALPQLHGTCKYEFNKNYFDAFHNLPDKEIKYEYEKKNGKDPPGVDINLLDLSEAVALLWLILQSKYVFSDHRHLIPDLDNGG